MEVCYARRIVSPVSLNEFLFRPPLCIASVSANFARNFAPQHKTNQINGFYSAGCWKTKLVEKPPSCARDELGQFSINRIGAQIIIDKMIVRRDTIAGLTSHEWRLFFFI